MKKLVLTSSDNPVTPEPGIYDSVPWDVYSSWNCFSKSMTDYALKSGEHLHHYIHGPRDQSKSMAMGSLVDCLLLEPDLFEAQYAIRPDTYISAKGEEKKWKSNANICKEQLHNLSQGGVKNVLTQKQHDDALSMCNAVKSHPIAGSAVERGKKQVSIVWDDKETGVRCKGRLDLLDDNIVYDLKTTKDASLDSFSRDLGNFGYHVQAGAYIQGLVELGKSPDEFRIIAVETSGGTEEPQCIIYRINPESVVAGLYRFQRALKMVATWLECGVEGYHPGVIDIAAPHWITQRELKAKGIES